MYYYMSSTNNVTTERAKLQAAMKKRKVDDKPEKEGLRLFNTSNFVACRDPADIARELYVALSAVPPRWTYHNTESKILELVQAYEAKAKSIDDAAERVKILDEYFRAKSWHENFVKAMNPTDGVTRGRLYQAFNAGVSRGKWKDQLEETIKRVKEEYKSSWEEKLFPKGVTKPESQKKAATAPSGGNATTAKGKYSFKNLTEYRLSRTRSMLPAFARPNNLPADQDKWCADCCWSDHVTADCSKRGRGRQQPQQLQGWPQPPQQLGQPQGHF